MTEKRSRGRPKGSKNKSSTSVLKGSGLPNGGAGHNGPPELTDAEERALMMSHASKVRNVEREIADLRAERKSLIGAAKAEGITAGDINEFNKMLNSEPDKIRADIDRKIRLARWTGQGVQADLFEALKSSPAEEVNAYQEGFQAGVEARPANPEGLVGAAHEEWMRGHHEGAESLRSGLAKVRQEEDDSDPFAELVSVSGGAASSASEAAAHA